MTDQERIADLEATLARVSTILSATCANLEQVMSEAQALRGGRDALLAQNQRYSQQLVEMALKRFHGKPDFGWPVVHADGGEYTYFGIAAGAGDCRDRPPIAVYRSEDGRLWWRTPASFADRFRVEY